MTAPNDVLISLPKENKPGLVKLLRSKLLRLQPSSTNARLKRSYGGGSKMPWPQNLDTAFQKSDGYSGNKNAQSILQFCRKTS